MGRLLHNVEKFSLNNQGTPFVISKTLRSYSVFLCFTMESSIKINKNCFSTHYFICYEIRYKNEKRSYHIILLKKPNS